MRSVFRKSEHSKEFCYRPTLYLLIYLSLFLLLSFCHNFLIFHNSLAYISSLHLSFMPSFSAWLYYFRSISFYFLISLHHSFFSFFLSFFLFPPTLPRQAKSVVTSFPWLLVHSIAKPRTLQGSILPSLPPVTGLTHHNDLNIACNGKMIQCLQISGTVIANFGAH